ncbi:sulfatase-like hydrolase/transferase [Myxococcus qinghaiensis]|uniref:sulfatase-like hydrolase/transferase n=1 Tax=Myxococcus qinghaiensis TaxID=2906758 RepID=UPI0020A7B4D4|nr:sulfatase-like hydrolase/transferase [Myxococcus qinghaiensis]MCP3166233.1 sulfatase-like hydrolase/transferase [Myxococcus qinghaiensis]
MPEASRPNILLLTVDQLMFPRFAYGPEGGFLPGIKDILGFIDEGGDDNPYQKFFPGFTALRTNAAVFRNHTIATSACIPSRAAIYTGQYGTRTGVTQTDGLFKSGDAAAFPWLEPDGIPTIGHWFQKAGYHTHYFGKWHVSNPPDHSLKQYGFDDWELSYPEPHGSSVNNLGTFRDMGFADLACTFLRRMALGQPYNRALAQQSYSAPLAAGPSTEPQPWLAVASFTNPHDIATYPILPRQLDSESRPLGPLHVPSQTARSVTPVAGSLSILLNPQDFPQENAHLPPNVHDSLVNKPSCQRDYAYKMGLALAAKTGLVLHQANENIDAVSVTLNSGIPFQLTAAPDVSTLRFVQYYTWLIHVVDAHIAQVLKTLDESGLRESTLVMFLSDHGEYAGAHGYLMEKWHTAYQEALHVPLVVQFPPKKDVAPTTRQIEALSSHVDVLPTLLGLAGIEGVALDAIRTDLRLHRPVPPFVGADLSPLARGETTTVTEPDGTPRAGVLFITDDEITQTLPHTGDPHQAHDDALFNVFSRAVDALREGTTKAGKVPELKPGAVCQPNHVRCVRTPRWKLARTWDPSGEYADQWELYDLRNDALELENLLVFDGAFPTVISTLPKGLTREEVEAAARETHALLGKYELEKLSPWPAL